MSKPRRKSFDPRDLVPVARSADFQDDREPSIRIGDLVRLNSGGPVMIVVDVEGDQIEVAWKGENGTVEEYRWARPCIHRVRDAW